MTKRRTLAICLLLLGGAAPVFQLLAMTEEPLVLPGPVEASCKKLASAGNIQFDVTRVTTRDPEGTPKNLETAEISLKSIKPSMIAGKTQVGDGEVQFFYNGNSVTLVQEADKVYGVTPAPATIDELLPVLEAEFGFTPAAAELLHSDPASLVRAVQSSVETKPVVVIDGEECDDIAFSDAANPWEIWISKRSMLPKKMVIKYRGADPVDVTYTFKNWNLEDKLDPAAFEFKAPSDFQKIEIKKPAEAQAPAAVPAPSPASK